jgi:hypothetical protein
MITLTEPDSDRQTSEFLPFSEEDYADACVHDEAERLRVESSLLDLTGVTSHPRFDDIEKKRWFQGMSMSDKLREDGENETADKLWECHNFQTIAKCDGCNKVVRFWNRCDIFFCPQCSPRLSKMRLDGLMWWVESLRRPKHLVLTFENVVVLTKEYVSQCKKSLAKFRRTKLMRPVSAGLWAMEITNKGKGWHLHFHLVVEAPWLPVREISRVWKKVNGGAGEVVWIEDATRGGLRVNLPKYVTKYVGKGFRPHEWTAKQLGEFVRAVEGGRTFGVFGELLGKRKEWSEWLKVLRESRRKCECGCCSKRYFSEKEWLIHEEGVPGWPEVKAPPPGFQLTQYAWRVEV